MTVATTPFDASEYLDDEAAQVELLSEALASSDIAVITRALSLVARARGMRRLPPMGSDAQ